MLKKLLCLSLIGLLSACIQNNLIGNKKVVSNDMPKPSNQNQLVDKPLTAKDIKHPKNKNATPSEIAECQKQGGQISKQGLLGHDFCVVEFADKGKVCSDSSDCQAGRCIADSNSFKSEANHRIKGVCPSNNIPFGCYGTVNKGELGGFLCVD